MMVRRASQARQAREVFCLTLHLDSMDLEKWNGAGRLAQQLLQGRGWAWREEGPFLLPSCGPWGSDSARQAVRPSDRSPYPESSHQPCFQALVGHSGGVPPLKTFKEPKCHYLRNMFCLCLQETVLCCISLCCPLPFGTFFRL